MKNLYAFLLLSIFLFTACDDIENQLRGTWVIDKAYINNNPVIWDLIGNAIGLDKDMTCNLPIIYVDDRHTIKETGTWEIIDKNKVKYLQIKTTNSFFNRTFEISNLRKIQDPVSLGYLMKMTLITDSLRLDCTRELY